MIPGTIFMSLLAGALFGVIRGLILVVFNATAGASSCFFLSKLIGRPLVSWFWPEKLRFFQAEVLLIFSWLYFQIWVCFFLLKWIGCMHSDSKAQGKAAELHALFENNSFVAQPFYQFGISNCRHTISYFLFGNFDWSYSSFLHYCQSKYFYTVSWLSYRCCCSVLFFFMILLQLLVLNVTWTQSY